MSLQCPRCHSPKVASFHHAMKAGAAIGAVGGLARGVSAALAGGKAGAALGLIAGPVGITLGSVSGAILGGLVIPPFLALARNRGQAARANFCLGVMPPRAIFGLS